MKLVFTKPPIITTKDGFKHADYASMWRAQSTLFAFLGGGGIGGYLHVDTFHSKLSYNTVYDFYDIALFPLSSRTTLDDYRAKFAALAAEQNWNVTNIEHTWRWDENKAQVDGLRIWIAATASGTISANKPK